MAEVVGTAQERRGQLFGVSASLWTFCQTCHQVDCWMGLPFSLRNKWPSGSVPNCSRCVRSRATSSGGIGTRRVGLRARGPAWVSPGSVPSARGAHGSGRRRCTPCRELGWRRRRSGDPSHRWAGSSCCGSGRPPRTAASWRNTCTRRTRRTGDPGGGRHDRTRSASGPLAPGFPRRAGRVLSGRSGGVHPSGRLPLLSGFLSRRFLRTAYPRALCRTWRREK